MGRIANKHLAKLWDFMANYNSKSAGATAGDIVIDILEAFLECDEALSELQDERDHWKTMYGNACGDQDVLKESIRLLDTENRRLMEENKDLKKQCDDLRYSYRIVDICTENSETVNQLQKDNEALERVIERNVGNDIANKEIIDKLRKENDKLRGRAEHAEAELEKLAKENDIVAARTRTIDELRQENEDLKKMKLSAMSMIDDFVTKVDELQKDRNCKAEAVVKLANRRDELQEALDNIRAELEAKVKRMDEITKERDSYRDIYTELKKDYDRLFEENKWSKARTNCLREEVLWYRKHYKEQSDKIRELKSRLNSIYGTELPDAKEEYTMTFAMDRENFDKLMAVVKEGMDNVKSVGDMRDFLKTFCEDHDSCRVCPLKECGSDLGRGFDSMSDEEIEEYYKIAIGAQSEREKPDLTFGDIVKVPWSHNDYIFRENFDKLMAVVKNEHLKWVGHIKK